jgi:putative spermidine/putrescine transport system ATP-binding protein
VPELTDSGVQTGPRDPIALPRDAQAPRPGASLVLRDLVKRYGDTVAVDRVSLDVRPGEFVTLLGPSGSGKTTTLNAIAGFADLSSGEILLDGRPIESLPPHRRNIGVVFQHYALFPHMTAAQNVAFPLRRRRVSKADTRRRVRAALDMVRLGDRADHYPRQLSGGQQQRVALARALVFEPRVLLMDEPLGALDKKLREWLQLEIKRIHHELGITFVYVTHDQEEALVLSDRIAVFSEGRIEQLGTAVELYERPQTLFVADFLGESNLFRGRLVGAPGALQLRCDDCTLDIADADGAPVGRASALMLRPEHVHVSTDFALAPGRNALHGSVRQVIYLGSARKIEVELPTGRTVIVKQPASEAHEALEPGTAVVVWWAIERAVLLEDA